MQHGNVERNRPGSDVTVTRFRDCLVTETQIHGICILPMLTLRCFINPVAMPTNDHVFKYFFSLPKTRLLFGKDELWSGVWMDTDKKIFFTSSAT